MPTAYLDDVQEAILAAYKNFTGNTEGNIEQHFQVETVTVILNRAGNRWDYGHPAKFRMHPGNAKLTEWWAEVEPNGVVQPAQYKPALGCREINVQWTSTGGRLFNYHVALEDA